MSASTDKNNHFERIAVFCGSSDGHDQTIYKAAYELGRSFAEQKIELVYGGSKLGLMGQVAKGVLDNGGKVIGVIPEFLKTKEVVHPGLTKLITTQTMQQRKLKMHELSDAFIALPGGFGTFEEFFEILTWGQLGLHQKPIGVLNVAHFYDDLLQMMYKMVAKGFLKKDNLNLVLDAENEKELFEKFKTYQPQAKPKWMKESQT